MRTPDEPGNFAIDVGYRDPVELLDDTPDEHPFDELAPDERAEAREARAERARRAIARRARA